MRGFVVYVCVCVLVCILYGPINVNEADEQLDHSKYQSLQKGSSEYMDNGKII